MKTLNLVIAAVFQCYLASVGVLGTKVSAQEVTSENLGCTGNFRTVLGQDAPNYCTSAEADSGILFDQLNLIRNSDQSINLEFRVFNRGSADALVEVYDSVERLQDIKIIDGNRPPTGLIQSGRDLFTKVPASLFSRYPLGDARRDLQEQNMIVTIPAGGSVKITKSSNFAIWYNTAMLGLEVAQLVQGDSELTKAETTQPVREFAKEFGTQTAINIFKGEPSVQSAFSLDFIDQNKLGEVLQKLLQYTYSELNERDPSKNPILGAFLDVYLTGSNYSLETLIDTYILPGLGTLVRSVRIGGNAVNTFARAADLYNATVSGQRATVTLRDAQTSNLGNIQQNEVPVPFLVKDIKSSTLTAVGVGNTLFFSTGELWKSDGTAEGTVLIKDIRSGSRGSTPRYLTAVGNTLFFRADDGVNGYELWKSDGTAEGTVLVKDIRTGSRGSDDLSSHPSNLTAVGNTLFFSALAGILDSELWKSDGTAEGTVLVNQTEPSDLTAVGNTLFFTADDAANGLELWKSDGTAQGTVLVKDIRIGYSGSFTRSLGSSNYLAAVGNTLFFTANDGVNGDELWKSNGTAQGTVLVKDIRTGSSGSNLSDLTAVGNTLFFRVDDGVNSNELWKSNGTAQGTVLVKDITTSSLTAVGNTLFFTANDGVNGNELWKSDGTAQGTVLVKDIRTGSSGSLTGSLAESPGDLTAVGNTLFFTANDGVNGEELWKSDGTAQGTVLVKDIRTGSSGSEPSNLTVVGNTLFFKANGDELWAITVDNVALPSGVIKKRL